MIIGVDGNEANVEHKVGVSVYTLQLLSYFKKHATKDIQFVIFLRIAPRSELPRESEFYTYKIVSGPLLWSQLFLPFHLWTRKLRKKNIDVFFSPAHYIPRFCPFKTVVTIHDLSYLYFPEEFLKKDLYQLREWTTYALKKSSSVIAVSKTTKKDLIKEYKIPEAKINVVYNGYEGHFPATKKAFQIKIDDPYILYVGTIQPRKNVQTLIKSFALFKKNHPEFKLVLVGKKGWLTENIFASVPKDMKDDIMFTGYVDDEEKNELYRKAFCFVLPSLYEGFGIPLLEAMSHHCPVISSFSSSLTEVGGEACLYFDPKSYTDLEEKLETLFENKELRSEMIAKGNKQITRFSWEKMGKETLDILTTVK